MELLVQQGDLAQTACDVLIVNLFEGVTAPGGATGAVDRALGGWISEQIAQQGFKGKAGSVLEFPTFGTIPAKRVVVVGLGKAEAFTLDGVRRAAGTAIAAAKKAKAVTVATLLHGAGIAGLAPEACAQAVAEGTLLGGYAFLKYKSEDPNEPASKIERVLVVEHAAAKLPDVERGVAKGIIIAEAVNMARDLASEPPDVVTPVYLADTAVRIAAQYGLRCTVWDTERIVEERMNCLFMVGRGSVHPPRFIRLDYVPEGTPKARVCLIGKGLCYDSGGLSLKPSEFMRHMKTDMSGAAAVLATMQAIGQLRPDVAVTGMIPACENMISGGAYKVDDVLRARNGKTIEVDNTDAEGRLVLADALSLAAEESFDATIDIATLTGACIIALARVWTGVMGSDEALKDAIVATGAATGEKMWKLPFDKEIRELLDSDLADIKNAGGREGGALSGGMFLQEFAGDRPWAHLDIAGTSYLDKPRPYEPKGATGVPVRTLVAYILSR
jgi:leucyl aminopeptidase